MAHLGHPVLGDTTYGKRPASFWHALGIERQLLHAYQLQFTHPATAKLITLTAPPPPDFAQWLNPHEAVL
jgi:23S rRNA-/tRNA-specific pseudouridylate synthase